MTVHENPVVEIAFALVSKRTTMMFITIIHLYFIDVVGQDGYLTTGLTNFRRSVSESVHFQYLLHTTYSHVAVS